MKDWLPIWIPTELCLRQKGGKKAVVVKRGIRTILPSHEARCYDGWIEDEQHQLVRKAYSAAGEFKVGQVLELDAE